MGEAWGGFQGFFWEVLHMVFALHLTLVIFTVNVRRYTVHWSYGFGEIFQFDACTSFTWVARDIFTTLFFDRFQGIVCLGVLGFFLYMEWFLKSRQDLCLRFFSTKFQDVFVIFSTAKDDPHVQISLACSYRPTLDEFFEIATTKTVWTCFFPGKNISRDFKEQKKHLWKVETTRNLVDFWVVSFQHTGFERRGETCHTLKSTVNFTWIWGKPI